MAERKVKVSDLVSTAEIADRLNLAQPETVHAWRRRYEDFPKPIAQLGGAGARTGFLVWAWPDVEAWARQTGRYPAKPDA